MINAKLQNIIDTKSAIGNAIVNKGGTITGETPFFNYAAQIDGISTGTPQTIFTASDGSKWALTNAVNLVNDAGNVTSDFNYWQPANNSTSDPILNIGTVGANISGNIRLVPVNQVNIAQYVNIVINDTTGAKYVGYNGYDSQTNPTPTGNTTFNRWLLNNSASGTIIFANTTVTNGGTYNGPNSSSNETNMAILANSANLGDRITNITSNNGFIYAGLTYVTGVNRSVSKLHASNLVVSSNIGNFLANNFFVPRAIKANNGFLYVGGSHDLNHDVSVRKFNESTLAAVSNAGSYADSGNGSVQGIEINNAHLFVVGTSISVNAKVKKYAESNLALIAESVAPGGPIFTADINNGFVFTAGGYDGSGYRIRKYHESNLVLNISSDAIASGSGEIRKLKISNNFVYIVGDGGANFRYIRKYHESNLSYVGNTPAYGGDILGLEVDSSFLYASGDASGGSYNQGNVKKYYASNLALVATSPNYGSFIASMGKNNSTLYVGGAGVSSNFRVQAIQSNTVTLETLTFYTATKIKE